MNDEANDTRSIGELKRRIQECAAHILMEEFSEILPDATIRFSPEHPGEILISLPTGKASLLLKVTAEHVKAVPAGPPELKIVI